MTGFDAGCIHGVRDDSGSVKSGELVKLGVYKCAHFVQNCVKFGEICNLGVLRFWGVRGGPKKGGFLGVF